MRWLLGGALAFTALLSTSAWAETDLVVGWGMHGENHTSFPPSVTPATSDELFAAVGNATYEVSCPSGDKTLVPYDSARQIYKQRTVKITLQKPGLAYRDLSVLSTLLDTAVERAWAECPIIVDNGRYQAATDEKKVGEAEIYARPTSGSDLRLVARGNDFGALLLDWSTVVDVYADQERERAEQQKEQARLRVYNEQCDLLIARGVAIERLENIDAIRESERLRIQNEVVQRRFEADIAGLQASVKIENLKAELAEAKQRRERIENPTAPPPPPAKKSEADKVSERLAEINALDAVMKAQRATFVASRGGEAKLTADDRARLEKLDVAHSVHMENLHQDLFR